MILRTDKQTMSSRHQPIQTSYGNVRFTPNNLLQKLLEILNATLIGISLHRTSHVQGAQDVMLFLRPRGRKTAKSSMPGAIPGVCPLFLLWLRILGRFPLICFLANQLMKSRNTGIRSHQKFSQKPCRDWQTELRHDPWFLPSLQSLLAGSCWEETILHSRPPQLGVY